MKIFCAFYPSFLTRGKFNHCLRFVNLKSVRRDNMHQSIVFHLVSHVMLTLERIIMPIAFTGQPRAEFRDLSRLLSTLRPKTFTSGNCRCRSLEVVLQSILLHNDQDIFSLSNSSTPSFWC